jgi:pimeloyl-ACP methyl ester carboxylesterase
MGGQVAELVAVSHAANLAGLELLVPAPLFGYPLKDEVIAGFRTRAKDPDPAAVANGKRALSQHLDDHALDILVRATLHTPPGVASSELDAWTGGHRLGAQRSLVSEPTLLVTSDDTFFSPRLLLDQVATRFHRIEVAEVSGAGHWPTLRSLTSRPFAARGQHINVERISE